MIKVCCVCSKVERNGDWLADTFTLSAEPITHGYCPVCYEDAMKELIRITKTAMDDHTPVVQDGLNQGLTDLCAF